MNPVGATRLRLRSAGIVLLASAALAPASAQTPAASQAHGEFVQQYCIACHSEGLKTGGLVLEKIDPSKIAEDAGVWERVLRQVSSGQMPPAGLPGPDDAARATFADNLEAALDQAARANPNPGVTAPHRLNRVEYSNAVRDLLGVDTKPGEALPVDDSGNGFDNQADLLSMSPALLERYMSLARSISTTAIGDLKAKPIEVEYGSSSRADRRDPNPLLVPLGARGGTVFEHYFPLDAEYEMRFEVPGTDDPQILRIPVQAGLHRVVATFLGDAAREEVALAAAGRRGSAPGGDRPPAQLDIRMDGDRLKLIEVKSDATPAVGKIIVAGPYNATGRGDTPSRQEIFVCRPESAQQEPACAKTIFSTLAHRAFRRPVADADIQPLLHFYNDARAKGGDFDQGIRRGLQAILVSPDFLFRVEHDPQDAAPGSVYRLTDHELASRLSFFLWSSIPDDELLALADQGNLRDPGVLQAQIQRMMADPKSDALIYNFGGQWLYLRTLANVKPDPEVFDSFDEDLRQAFQRETELFLTSIFREDRNVLEMLDADYTYLNERLAKHYGIANVYGPQFRKVSLPAGSPRGGLLGQGSVLTVTSYPNRTSVVQRGKWILENLLGTPPPPPPPDVPELQPQGADGRKLSMREQMEMHRASPVCASCHGRMDPIGFALENFDGVGEWRDEDSGVPIDPSGRLPNGQEFAGPAGLRKLLVAKHGDEFLETVTEKLMIYALGRGLAPYDKPTVRAIVRQAGDEDYRMSAFIEAVVESVPFQMRRAREQ